MKQINFVYSRNKLDFKKFAKITDYDDVISYHDIITKLVKNDSDNDKPSVAVVNSYLRKKIMKTMSDRISFEIIYALKDLDPETISSIIELMDSYACVDTSYSLTVITHKKFNVDDEEIKDVKTIDALKEIKYVKV